MGVGLSRIRARVIRAAVMAWITPWHDALSQTPQSSAPASCVAPATQRTTNEQGGVVVVQHFGEIFARHHLVGVAGCEAGLLDRDEGVYVLRSHVTDHMRDGEPRMSDACWSVAERWA